MGYEQSKKKSNFAASSVFRPEPFPGDLRRRRRDMRRVSLVASAIRREATGILRDDGRRPRAPIPDIGGPGCRGHTIPRRGFNLFKPLRRHFPASPFCRRALPRRGAGDRNAAARRPMIGSSRPASPMRAARRAPTDRLQAAAGGTASTEPDTRPSPSGRRHRNKYRTSATLSRNCFFSRETRRLFSSQSQGDIEHRSGQQTVPRDGAAPDRASRSLSA